MNNYKEATNYWEAKRGINDNGEYGTEGYAEVATHRPPQVPEIEVIFSSDKPILIGMNNFTLDEIRWLLNRLQEAITMVEIHRAEKA